MSKFYVYGHFTLDANELFYIGKGVGNRLNDKRKRNPFWYNVIQKHGCRAEILHSGLNEDEAYLQEYLAIKEFCPRTNLNPGGTGFRSEQVRVQWKDPEYRIKMAEIQRARHARPGEKERISAKVTARWKDPNYKKLIAEKTSKALTGKKLSPEHSEKCREALKVGRLKIDHAKRIFAVKLALTGKKKGPLTLEHKALLLSYRLGSKASEQTKLKQSQGHGSKPFLVYTVSGEYVGEWINKRECARILDLSSTCIARCLKKQEGRTKHKGYTFRFKEL